MTSKTGLTPQELYEHIKRWREDSLANFNENIAGNSPLEQRVILTRIQSLEYDVKQLLLYTESLAKLLLPSTENNQQSI